MYQIWITYNKKWSNRDILIFSVILLVTIIMIICCLYHKKINMLQAMSILVLVIFLGIVFAATVFTRTDRIYQYELVPLWSWKRIIQYHDWKLLKENLLNCILLLPVGMLLPISLNREMKWYQALMLGIVISALIEVSQLIFKKGLFEGDDMIHNGLGCMIGGVVGNYMIRFFKWIYRGRVNRKD